MHTDQRHSAGRVVLHRGWTSAARDALQHVKHSTAERESGISDAPFQWLSSTLRGCGIGAELRELSAVLVWCRASADTPPQTAHAAVHGRRSRAYRWIAHGMARR